MLRVVVVVVMVGAITGMVGLLGFLPVAAQVASATRSFNPATVEPDGEVVVTIEPTGYGSLGAVTETLPAGFSYDSSSLTDEGEVTEVDARTVRFTLQGADKTFTYTVRASNTAGSHDFSGKLRDSDRADHDVGGASSVTVTTGTTTSEASATRFFNPATVEPDGEVVVTIEPTGYGSLGAVTETLPAGFSYDSSSLTDEGEVTEVDARTVRFTLQGADKTFTYTVRASNTAGSHDFSGKLRDSDRADHDVGGASSVTVTTGTTTSEASATRFFNPATVEPDGEVVVTIEPTGYGSLGAVTETLPAGFSYDSSSLTDEGEVTEVDARTVRFTLQGADKTFTYTVRASNTAGSHDFSGKLRDSDRADHDVGGASSVTVLGPRATRSFSSTRVRPSGPMTVTITARDYGSLGAVVETLPNGFAYVSSALAYVEEHGMELRFALLDPNNTSFMYTVRAPSSPGSYEFMGRLIDDAQMSQDVGGDMTVMVQPPAVQPPAVARPAPPRRGGGGGGRRGGFAPPVAKATPTPIVVPTIIAPAATPTPEPTMPPPTEVPTARPKPTVAPTPVPTAVPPPAMVEPTELPAPTATPAPTVAPVTPVTPEAGGMPVWLIIVIIIIIVAVVIAAVGFYLMRMRR